MKQIRYTSHAICRMFERDMSEKDIVKTITNPDYTKTSFQGRKVAVKKSDGRTISAVYLEKEAYISVITVY